MSSEKGETKRRPGRPVGSKSNKKNGGGGELAIVDEMCAPLFKQLPGGGIEFTNEGVGRLLVEAVGGEDAMERVLREDGVGGVMRRVLTDGDGIIRGSILARCLERGLGGVGGGSDSAQRAWLKLAATMIREVNVEREKEKGFGKYGSKDKVPISRRSALEITPPVRRVLRELDGPVGGIEEG